MKSKLLLLFSLLWSFAGLSGVGTNNKIYNLDHVAGNGVGSVYHAAYQSNGSPILGRNTRSHTIMSKPNRSKGATAKKSAVLALGVIGGLSKSNDNVGNNRAVRIYNCTPTFGTQTVSTCSAYTWIDGITYYSSNNTATFVLTNAAGCDSTVTLNLTIAPAPSSSCTEQNMVGTNTYGSVAMGQSITASCSGSLTSVTIYTGNTTAAPSTITILQGNAWNGTVLATQTVSNFTAGANVINFTTPTSVTAGSQYTIYVSSSGSGVPNLMIEYSDQYAGGQVFLGSATTTWDLKFQAVISGPTLPCPGDCVSPVVTTQPSNSMVCLGGNGSFTVSATDVQTYQWQVNTGSTFVNVSNDATYSGATTATLNITAPTIGMSGYQYRCVLGNLSPNTTVACSTTTASKTLTVNVSTTSTTTISACNTYTWTNGTTYNTSGTYTQMLVNAQGCDSVATLDLTILPTPTNQTVTISPLTSVCQAVATVSVASTQTGYNYYLRNDSDNSIVQGPVAGTGSAINFTPQTVNATHTYNVYVVPTSPSTYGMNFDGTNDYIELSNINLANSSYTLETQFKTTVGGRIITIGSSLGASYEQTGIKVSSNGNIAYYFYGDDGIVNGTNAANGAWHHVAFSFDNVTKVGVLYLDGVQIGTHTYGNNLQGSGLARLGSRNWGGTGDYYNGQLDDVRIWNVLRTGSQISSNMNSCLTGAEAGLVALYSFNEGPTNSTTADATTHGHTGTMVNMNSTTNWITGIPGCAVTGCPIVMTTHPTVTITPTAGSSSSVTACNSYTWSNGVTYTASGTYSRIIPSALGCDSTLTLNLTIKHSTTSTTTISACNTYTWTNGATYTTSGVYSQTLVNAAGCDSVATLNLTIKHSTTSTTNISACDTYTWTNGTTYNTSGTYTQTLVNAQGCDSVATLNLTIKHSTASTTTISACNTYTWTNGTTYNTSGTYTQTLVNAAGCDSVATLDLTILPTPTNQTVTIYPLTSVCQAVATVTVASTQTGYNYYLRNDSDNSIVQGPVAGTGSAINFTPQTVNATHTYNVYVVQTSPSTYGMNFDGTNDYIELSNINLANSSYTLETQFKTTVGGRVITIGSSTGASYEQTGITVFANGTIRYYFYGDDGIVNGTNAANGAWHHVAFSFDNVTKVGVLYLDGVQIGTRTFGDNLHGSGLARLGSRNWGGTGDYYNGQLDDVRIWNVLRTGSQISSNMNSCLTGAEAGLVALYTFNEGPTNSTTTDATTHGHTGTMANMNSTTNWITGIPGCAVTGCPIVMATHPTVTITPTAGSSSSVTACNSYTWSNGVTYTASGTYSRIIPSALGCDSTLTLNLTIKHSTTSTTNVSACNTYTWTNGSTYTTSGVYSQTLVNAQGCDSVATLNLTIKHSTTSTTTISACNTYTWTNGATYTTSGVYSQTLVNAQGCDSVATLNLTIKHSTASTTNISACNTYTWTNGATYTTSGVYSQTLVNSQGCDSVATLNLTIKHSTASTTNISACNTYTWTNGATYTTSGVYSQTLVNAQGCDSVATLNLTIKHSTTSTTTISACNTYTWTNGATYTISGVYSQTLVNAAGCDSVATLNLTIKHSTTSTTNISSCNTYTWTNGATYTTSGVYSQTLVNAQGCDSVATLNLTIKHSTTSTTNISACNTYTWTNGTTYTTSGVYSQTLVNAAGCDSVATLNLTIKHSTTSTTNISACNTYTWTNGTTYTTSGVYSQTLVNAQGCDSVATLNLTIKHSTTSTTNISSCNTYTWTNGATYTTSGVYSQTLVNAQGCDSIATLNLTINQPTTSSLTQTACSSYVLNGTTYTASGTYTQTLMNAAGCDSTITLNLTINQPTTSSLTQTACSSYVLNGTTYTASGTYTQTLINAAGCDSTITLNLTINQPTTSSLTQTACSSYVLNGTTYTASGTYTQTLMNAAGCDSTITLNLTINQPTTSSLTQTACSSYVLNGTTYTTSGTYTQTLINAAGCDSTITLNLTINQPTSSTTTITQCGGTYTWTNGVTYNASGTHTQTLMNAAGCDSTATLVLTINALPVATATDNGNATITASSGNSYQWINCATGAVIAGATTQTFTPSANGSYAVVISNSSECVDTSTCVTIINVGIKENTSVSIAVFPNPTHNEVTVTMDAASAKIEVVDAQGKLLQTTQVISGGKVDLSAYETGVYFLKITTESGSTLERIVKN
ncbi:LamG-like jellyroll fold domain-containing protein [Fluviicola sp.]|uniref:LamG-like jellyroll fold domain-containing protein n=1 Tax=Fluviicola sp. TaxID=1917219 RepID=UPI003D290A72